VEGEAMAIGKNMIVEGVFNALIVKKWVKLKTIATLYMVFLTRESICNMQPKSSLPAQQVKQQNAEQQ